MISPNLFPLTVLWRYLIAQKHQKQGDSKFIKKGHWRLGVSYLTIDPLSDVQHEEASTKVPTTSPRPGDMRI